MWPFVLGKNIEAITQYDRILAIKPCDEDALNNKANVLSRQGKYTEADELYDKALHALQNRIVIQKSKTKPAGIQIDNLNGPHQLIKYNQYPTRDSIKEFDNILNYKTMLIIMDKNKESSGLKHVGLTKDTEVLIIYQFNKGVGKYHDENYDDANFNFDKVLQMNSSFAPGLYYKFLCLEKLGQTDKAAFYKNEFNITNSAYKGELLDTTKISIPNTPIEQLFGAQ